jgi:phosphoserine phosphatase RsbU/P
VAVVSAANRRFLAMGDSSLYLTMLFGLLDVETGKAALVQAGHPPALYAAPGAREYRAVGEGGVPIGILAAPGYEAVAVHLGPGARLVLHSDGLTDCRNAADESFGTERMQALLADAGGQPLSHAGEQLHAAVRAWGGGRPLDDDLALLALEAG